MRKSQRANIRLHSVNGVEVSSAIKHPAGLKCDAASCKYDRRNQPSLEADFISRQGGPPTAIQASVIGRLSGRRIRASDGVLYPAISANDKEINRRDKQERKQYHTAATEVARLNQAFSLFQQLSDPCGVAIHMKKIAELEQKIDRTLNWLHRFAAELASGDKAGFR